VTNFDARTRIRDVLSGRGNGRVLSSILVDTIGTGMFMSLVLLYLVRVNHVAPALAGTLVTVAAISSFAAMPLVSRIIHRLKGRDSLILCSLVSAGGYAIYFVARSPFVVVVAALLVALGDRLNGAAWPVLAAEQFGRDRLKIVFGVTNTAKTVALGVGALTAAAALALNNNVGLRVALGANVASYIAGLAILLFVPRKRAPEIVRSRLPLSVPLRDHQFMRLVVSQTSLSASWIIPGVAFPLFLTRDLGLAAALAAIMLTLRYCVISVVQIPLIRLTSQWRRGAVLAFSGGSSVAGLAAVLLLPLVSGTLLIVMVTSATTLFALSEVISKPTAAAEAVRLSPPGDEAPYMAVFQATWTLAYALGPAAIGFGIQAPEFLWAGILAIVVAGSIYGLSKPLSTKEV
jgi:Major Facilitator Superfamily